MKTLRFTNLVLTAIFSFTLIGCGGGDSGGIDGSGFDNKYLQGTAATGAAIKNTEVMVKGKNGKKSKSSTDEKGKFKIDVTELTAPYLLKTNAKNQDFYSLALEDGQINIHPLTDFVIRNWYAIKSRNIDEEFSNDNPIENPPAESDITPIVQTINNIMDTTFTQLQVPEDFNFLTSVFEANSTGFDKLLDFTQIVNQQNNITINVIDPVTQLQTTLIEGFDLASDITVPDTQEPTKPVSVNAITASDTNIVLSWISSSDNISIAGYNIYRDNNKISTVAFPTFVDSSLNNLTRYCYEIEAFDAAGNKSMRSISECTTTFAGPGSDNTPPSPITDLQVVTLSDTSIKLSWSKIGDSDVLGYRIYLVLDEEQTPIASVINDMFIDLGLQPETNYCYLVKAFDASENESVQDTSLCATTSSITQDNNPPASVSNVETLTNSSSSIKISWSPVDDVDLNGYRIYRKSGDDLLKIATVESTVFADQNLEGEKEYCYVVKAIDTAGNESEQTDNICQMTANGEDNIAPNAVDSLSAVAETSQSMRLDWNAVADNDVMGYRIYIEEDNISQKLATVYEPAFTLSGLQANKEYCFSIKAIDVSDNISETSNIACDTTAADITAPPITEAFPKGNTFNTPQKVWLACFDQSGLGCANIYYTLDNTEPTTESLLYTDSIDINETTTLKFLSMDNNGLIGQTKMENFIIEFVNEGLPQTVALPNGGSFNAAQKVWLTCFDNGSSGCADTYYTLDGSEPTANSFLYSDAITLRQDTILKYASVDNSGTFETTKSTEFTIALPTDPILEVVNINQNGLVTSEDGFINCGLNCINKYDLDTIVTLTATHPDNLSAIWSGCETVDSNQCTTTMDRARKIIVSFVTQINENDSNNTFATAYEIFDSTIVKGFYNAEDDKDYYLLNVTKQGSVYLEVDHPTANSTVELYDDQFNSIVSSSGGCCSVKSSHFISRTLSPGTYYIGVISRNVIDLDISYTFKISGTVFNQISPDINEENDNFGTATTLINTRDVNGYYDTVNDVDYFEFTIDTMGTFYMDVNHPTANSNVVLYDNQFSTIVSSSGGCCNVKSSHSISRTLQKGKYYIGIFSRNVTDLTIPYEIHLAGTVFGDTSPDAHEQNDVFANAISIDGNNTVQGYYDTVNDVDYFTFSTNELGSFYMDVNHSSANSTVVLYDDQFAEIVSSSGGCCNVKSSHSISRTIPKGTYYIGIFSRNITDLDEPYSLDISGTVFGDVSPDVNEENNIFANAASINGENIAEGYFDTVNDIDYFTFSINELGSFYMNVNHPSANSTVVLYDDQFVEIVSSSGGCCNVKSSHSISRTIPKGTYYFGIFSRNVTDMTTSYSVDLSGTVFGDTPLDQHEENDNFQNASPIVISDDIVGYYDTVNDEDYFVFNVDIEGATSLNVKHPTANSTVILYDDQFNQIVSSSGGCCNVKSSHLISQTLTVGKYYIGIFSRAVTDLNTPYQLSVTQ